MQGSWTLPTSFIIALRVGRSDMEEGENMLTFTNMTVRKGMKGISLLREHYLIKLPDISIDVSILWRARFVSLVKIGCTLITDYQYRV